MSDQNTIDVDQVLQNLKLKLPQLLARLKGKLEAENIFIKDPNVLSDEEKQAVNKVLRAHFGGGESTAAQPKITLHKRQKEVKMGGATVVVRAKHQVDVEAAAQREEEQRLLAKKRAEKAATVAPQIVAPTPVIVSPPAASTSEKPPEKSTTLSLPARSTTAHKTAEKPVHRKPVQEVVRKSKAELEEEALLSKLGHGRHHHRKSGAREVQPVFVKPAETIVREVRVSEANTIPELAAKMALKSTEVIKTLMNLGVMVTINQVIDHDTAFLVVEELGHKPITVNADQVEHTLLEYAKGSGVAEKRPRPPVVTIMGHVDHGKTSLLDYIRRTRVTAGEAGGITQHIGAYHVDTPKGVITFLDTPGHEAFTAMRARGAKLTDIIVLVVAADDGVMPQTEEAIKHAHLAKVPIIVAVNKMDKPDANAEKIKQQLLQHEVIPEDLGGDVMFAPVSAKTGQGIDHLLEMILLQAEVLHLEAEMNCPARGVVVESRLDKGRGIVASLLVQAGQLKKGDIVLAGLAFGKIRALLDENSKEISEVGPGIPVEILGLSALPLAGDDFLVLPNERKAREVANARREKSRALELAKEQASKHENIFNKLQTGEQLNIVLKADVQGSLEALVGSLSTLNELKLEKNGKPITIKVIYKGVGPITESDVSLAHTSNALILGFNVRAESTARAKIQNEGLTVMYHSIIYAMVDEVKSALLGLAGPVEREVFLGYARVGEIFRSPRFGSVAGCKLTEGVIKRSKKVRILRDGIVIFQGEISSLRHGKEDVNEITSGECGIGIKNYNDFKVGDVIENYDVEIVQRTA